MYICVEAFTASDGKEYEELEEISDEAYAFLQPDERENFTELEI